MLKNASEKMEKEEEEEAGKRTKKNSVEEQKSCTHHVLHFPNDNRWNSLRAQTPNFFPF